MGAGVASVTKGLGSFVKQAALTTASLVKQAAAWIANTAATVAHRVASIAAAAAQKAQAAAQWLLNAAMSANPIGLVVAAIAALVAGFVIAYKKSETFRKIVTTAWEGIKRASTAVFGFLVRYFKTWVNLVRAALSGITKVVSWVVDKFRALKEGVVSAVSSAVDFVKGIPDKVKDAFGDARRLLYSAGEKVVRGLWNGMKAVKDWLYDKVRGFASGIYDKVKEGLGKLWPGSPLASRHRARLLLRCRHREGHHRELAARVFGHQQAARCRGPR